MPSDRRMFLGAGLGVTAALASRASGLTTAAQAVSSESPPRPGNISFEPELRAAAAHDFGRLIHGQPRGVLKPASSADIASLMRWAKGQGLKVAARGQGHSTYGRALVEDGIVVDMSAMNSIRDIKPDRVVVDAGITWKDLLDATLALGTHAAGADQLSRPLDRRNDRGGRHWSCVIPPWHANRQRHRAGCGDGRGGRGELFGD